METSYRPDVVVVVPKNHELRELQRAFGTDFQASDGQLDCGAFWYRMSISETNSSVPLLAAVVFLNDQGSSRTAAAVKDAVHEFGKPPLLILFGTAAGRSDKTGFGDVVVSTEGVMDVTQQAIARKATHRPVPTPIDKKIKADVCRFLTLDTFDSQWRTALDGLQKMLEEKNLLSEPLWAETPRVLEKMVAGGDSLYETDSTGPGTSSLEEVWELNDHLRCIDMESAGFCSGVDSETRQYQWLVVRGISDTGTSASRSSSNKKHGSLAAAAWLKLFLSNGLLESHPRGLKPRQEDRKELGQTSVFASLNVGTIAHRAEAEFKIDLTPLDLGASLTLDDFAAICVSRGAPAKGAKESLQRIREEYFAEKYASYTYSNDVRGAVPQWAREIHDILYELGVNISRCRVLDVGVSNGLELSALFLGARELTAVDVSQAMLAQCASLYEGIRTIHAAAEDLSAIPSCSVDLYASFRTYQSSLFDVFAAIREAHRVLVQEGVFLVSIANGFVENIDGQKTLVRGLLVPGSTLVDRNLPYGLGNQVRERLQAFGFVDVGTRCHSTDVYVYGRKP